MDQNKLRFNLMQGYFFSCVRYTRVKMLTLVGVFVVIDVGWLAFHDVPSCVNKVFIYSHTEI